MEISIKSFIMLGAVILTGLSAGLFYGWSVSVIPGTQNVQNSTYLETMQSINKAILNPAFYIVFFGSIVFLSLASIHQFQANKMAFWVMSVSSITYLMGTVGVTGLGNVPLNDQLDVLKLSEMSDDSIAAFREYYETNWNHLHLIRMIFSVVSFSGAVWGFFLYNK